MNQDKASLLPLLTLKDDHLNIAVLCLFANSELLGKSYLKKINTALQDLLNSTMPVRTCLECRRKWLTFLNYSLIWDVNTRVFYMLQQKDTHGCKCIIKTKGNEYSVQDGGKGRCRI